MRQISVSNPLKQDKPQSKQAKPLKQCSQQPTAPETSTQLQGPLLHIARGAWIAIVGYALVVFFASLPVYLHNVERACSDTACQISTVVIESLKALGIIVNGPGLVAVFLGVILLWVLIWCVVAAMIFWHKSHDWMALLVSLMLVLSGITTPGIDGVLAMYELAWRVPVQCLQLLHNTMLILMLALFPDGRFVPHWMRWFTLIWLALGGLNTFFPDLLQPINSSFGPTSFLFWGFIIALLYRYWRCSTPTQRQQTRWVILAISLITLGMTLSILVFEALPHIFPQIDPFPHRYPTLDPYGWIYQVSDVLVWNLSTLLIPIAFAISILRYRLWNIEILVKRALVYGILTTCALAIYVLVVGTMGLLFQTQGNVIFSLLATALIAVLFQPLRNTLQRAINRLIYGEREDPYTALSHLGKRLETTIAPEAMMPTIVETVAQTFKLSYVAIRLQQQGEYVSVATYGVAREPQLHLPLLFQGELLGDLVLDACESFTKADRRLLNDFARQAGVAAHSVRLTADLQHSRLHLVTTREEERRRLRRDLHDGLGPSLAALNLQAGMLRTLIAQNPEAAQEAVTEWRKELREAIGGIRRLVYDLRPPALDELGLIGAIQEQADRYSIGVQQAPLKIIVEAKNILTTLPAAVEVAAYRITMEALANVVRHARATVCHIHFWQEDGLHLEIADDGMGCSDKNHVGIGMHSMRERAAELGGKCTIEQVAAGGTRVYARLPFPKE